MSATAHVDRLLENENAAYLVPEALTHSEAIGEYLDVFSLGAFACFWMKRVNQKKQMTAHDSVRIEGRGTVSFK